mmetsp:Transcript_118683/g.231012  ORF Transcript_118683/g.231012 Transcript_118683/m.231012 type:complete len:218 (-) Transcript_118683:57-710(-)
MSSPPGFIWMYVALNVTSASSLKMSWPNMSRRRTCALHEPLSDTFQLLKIVTFSVFLGTLPLGQSLAVHQRIVFGSAAFAAASSSVKSGSPERQFIIDASPPPLPGFLSTRLKSSFMHAAVCSHRHVQAGLSNDFPFHGPTGLSAAHFTSPLKSILSFPGFHFEWSKLSEAARYSQMPKVWSPVTFSNGPPCVALSTIALQPVQSVNLSSGFVSMHL